MKGFFSKEEVKSSPTSGNRKSSCFSCGLLGGSKNPAMKPYGNFKKEIMLVGDFPGLKEDFRNKPWQGKDGRLLQITLRNLGIDLFEDCVSLYAVNCLPDNNKPTGKQIECCRDVKVIKAVLKYKPKILILLGDTALLSFIGHRWNKSLGGMVKWRGWTIPDQDFNTWVCPTFSPSYVTYMGLNEVEVTWKRDLKRALSLKKLPTYNEPNIQYIKDLTVLDSIESGMAAFDYENTGLKPYFKGHRIVCVSIAYDRDNVFVFMLPDRKSERAPFIRFLANRKIKKIASNMKYEHQWSGHILKTDVKGWFHDTMLTAHNLDNRRGISGLKFQAFVKMGVTAYSDDVDNYITKSREKGNRSNAKNMIFELVEQPGGAKDLMKYCALDSIYEYRLTEIQLEEINNWK